MALKKEKRFFDYTDRIGVSRGGDFDTLQSYSAREAQGFENLMREQSNIALKEAKERGEERGLLEANRYDITHKDIEYTNADGETEVISVPQKYEVPKGLSGKTALATFKKQAHKRYMSELSLSNERVISQIYQEFKSGTQDPQAFNDAIQDRLGVVYEQLDSETRNLLKFEDEKSILEKTQVVSSNFIERNNLVAKRKFKTDTLNIKNSRNKAIINSGITKPKDKYNYTQAYLKRIKEDYDNNLISQSEYNEFKNNFIEETTALENIHNLFQSKFLFLGTNNATPKDYKNLLALQEFLQNDKQLEVTIDGTTINRKQLEKAAGINKKNNIETYSKLMNIPKAVFNTQANKFKSSSQIKLGIETYNKNNSYNFGLKSGKEIRKLAQENEEELYDNWRASQIGYDIHVSFDQINENPTIAKKWKNHKLKHGLISTIEKDMIINNLRSSDPDTVLQTINSRELEIMSVNYASYDFTDEEENLVDMYRQFKDIPEIEQRSKLEIIREQSMPGATKDNVLSDILKSQSNDNYNTPQKLYTGIEAALRDYTTDMPNDIVFNIVGLNQIKNTIARRVKSNPMANIEAEDINNWVFNEMKKLESNAGWGFSEFGKPAASLPISIKDKKPSNFVRYPIEKNETYRTALQSEEKKSLLYDMMKEKWKKTLNKKITDYSDNTKRLLNYNVDSKTFTDGYGTREDPKLFLRGRRKNDGTIEYVIIYYDNASGVEYTLQEEVNETLRLDNNDLEFLLNE